MFSFSLYNNSYIKSQTPRNIVLISDIHYKYIALLHVIAKTRINTNKINSFNQKTVTVIRLTLCKTNANRGFRYNKIAMSTFPLLETFTYLIISPQQTSQVLVKFAKLFK